LYMLLGRILISINREAEELLCQAEALPFIHLFSQSS